MRSLRSILGRRLGARAGLSLVELLGVVAIILVFTMMVVTSNSYATKSAHEVTFQQQLVQLQKAIDSWVAGKPSLNVAIRDWNDNFVASSSLLVWSDGPMASMFVGGSQPKFEQSGALLTTYAGKKLNRGFSVTWPDKTRDPSVVIVSLP